MLPRRRAGPGARPPLPAVSSRRGPTPAERVHRPARYLSCLRPPGPGRRPPPGDVSASGVAWLPRRSPVPCSWALGVSRHRRRVWAATWPRASRPHVTRLPHLDTHPSSRPAGRVPLHLVPTPPPPAMATVGTVAELPGRWHPAVRRSQMRTALKLVIGERQDHARVHRPDCACPLHHLRRCPSSKPFLPSPGTHYSFTPRVCHFRPILTSKCAYNSSSQGDHLMPARLGTGRSL